MFGKNKRKVECMICGKNIENKRDTYVSYLKVNGHIGIHLLHRECYKKIQNIKNKQN